MKKLNQDQHQKNNKKITSLRKWQTVLSRSRFSDGNNITNSQIASNLFSLGMS